MHAKNKTVKLKEEINKIDNDIIIAENKIHPYFYNTQKKYFLINKSL